MDSMFFSFFDEPLGIDYKKVEEEKCPKCGYTFSDYAKTGLLGCDECYTTFANKLEPVLHKLHGKSCHIKQKNNTSKEKPKNKLEKLQEQLKECIEKEEYEKAAQIRDEIKALRERGEG
jgi:protein arginine kinase activator